MRVLRLLLSTSSKSDLEQRVLQHIESKLASDLKSDTIAKDVTHIRWALQVLNHTPSPRLRLLLQHTQRGMRRREIVEPKSKALPMVREIMESTCKALQRTQPATAVAIRLAFEAAGRVGDIFHLTPKSFVPFRDEGILILWGVTKARQTTEARADHQQIIRCKKLRVLLKHPNILQQTSSAKVLAAIKRVLPTQDYVREWASKNPTHEVRSSFTLHSLKRGRAAELWRMAAAGRMTVAQVLHELKHKSIEAGLAYAPAPATAAEAVEIQKRTQ